MGDFTPTRKTWLWPRRIAMAYAEREGRERERDSKRLKKLNERERE